jgi:hypothetical protein
MEEAMEEAVGGGNNQPFEAFFPAREFMRIKDN